MEELKMFKFNSDIDHWICAYTKEQAINIFKGMVGDDVYQDIVECEGGEENMIEELDDNDTMTYYHDGSRSEKTTYRNLINKYCDKPDIFACSEF